MSEFFKTIRKFPTCYDIACDTKNLSSLKMFVVKNHRDVVLVHPPELLEYEVLIQAGTDITNMRFASITDNTGDNISKKNKQYCEMTATYWVWKNTKYDWVGIEHYRRRLVIKETMLNNDVDVILPLPYMCYPNTVAQFRRFVNEDILKCMLNALKVIHPTEYEDYCKIIYGSYQYT